MAEGVITSYSGIPAVIEYRSIQRGTFFNYYPAGNGTTGFKFCYEKDFLVAALSCDACIE